MLHATEGSCKEHRFLTLIVIALSMLQDFLFVKHRSLFRILSYITNLVKMVQEMVHVRAHALGWAVTGIMESTA